ncbi:MAG: hypothetical protein OJF58_003214 [Enhydrobacter sp.]|nr:MAG: hypothetical protein OJF58_003214 [Enhydrobacter sp.]
MIFSLLVVGRQAAKSADRSRRRPGSAGRAGRSRQSIA